MKTVQLTAEGFKSQIFDYEKDEAWNYNKHAIREQLLIIVLTELLPAFPAKK